MPNPDSVSGSVLEICQKNEKFVSHCKLVAVFLRFTKGFLDKFSDVVCIEEDLGQVNTYLLVKYYQLMVQAESYANDCSS